jgi:hypothetical protein
MHLQILGSKVSEKEENAPAAVHGPESEQLKRKFEEVNLELQALTKISNGTLPMELLKKRFKGIKRKTASSNVKVMSLPYCPGNPRVLQLAIFL